MLRILRPPSCPLRPGVQAVQLAFNELRASHSPCWKGSRNLCCSSVPDYCCLPGQELRNTERSCALVSDITMALQVGTEHQDPQPAEEEEQKEQQLQQPQGDLQHPSGPSVTVSSADGDPHVNGAEARETASRGSARSLSSATAQTSTPPAAETAAATAKREGQRKKGNTWLDIFSFGRWRSSSNRQQGAIQLAQAFGAPNQPGRPVRLTVSCFSLFLASPLCFCLGSVAFHSIFCISLFEAAPTLVTHMLLLAACSPHTRQPLGRTGA